MLLNQGWELAARLRFECGLRQNFVSVQRINLVILKTALHTTTCYICDIKLRKSLGFDGKQ